MSSDMAAVGELIAYGLNPRMAPGRDAHYADLVGRYIGDPEFRADVQDVSSGQGLTVLDCSPVYGLALTSGGPRSPFHMTLDQYASMKTDERHMNALVFLAIATACYPTPESLEATDGPLPSVTVQGVVRFVQRVAARIRDQAGESDPPVDEPQLEPMYRMVLRWRDTDTTGDDRSNPRVLTGMVRRALKWLAANGLAEEVSTAKDTYRMRSRFRLHVLDALGDIGDSLATIRDLAADRG